MGKKLKKNWLVPVAIFVVIVLTHVLYTYNQHQSATINSVVDEAGIESREEYVKARAIEIFDISSEENKVIYILEAELLGGKYKGERVVMRNVIRRGVFPLFNVKVMPGDTFLCRVAGVGDNIESSGNIIRQYSYDRDRIILCIAGLLAILIILIGRKQGIRTTLALILAGMVIYFVMLPLLNRGKNPILVVTLSCGIIAAASLLIVAGFSRKTYSAIFGVVGGVLVAAVIVVYGQAHLHLKGTETYKAAELIESQAAEHIDFEKLLLSGMLIGLLGAAMDGAIDVASSMNEVRNANPQISAYKLMKTGMNVGTDVIGTMANTLLFAYFGFRLLLVLSSLSTTLFTANKMQLLSIGVVSAEIMRILAGSIGLVLTIPITVVIAGFWETNHQLHNV